MRSKNKGDLNKFKKDINKLNSVFRPNDGMHKFGDNWFYCWCKGGGMQIVHDTIEKIALKYKNKNTELIWYDYSVEMPYINLLLYKNGEWQKLIGINLELLYQFKISDCLELVSNLTLPIAKLLDELLKNKFEEQSSNWYCIYTPEVTNEKD